MNIALLAKGVAKWAARLRRLPGFIRAYAVLRGCEVSPPVFVAGRLLARPNGGSVWVGRGCVFLDGLEPSLIASAPAATVAIGRHTVINYGARIESRGGDVTLGRRCLVASGVRVVAAPGRSVHIGDDVWLAHGVVVNPGVAIGDGAVVGAASVVSSNVPPGALALGNPARPLRLAEPRER